MEKILVIEDEENIRGFIEVNLKRSGYNVLQAETGEDGLTLFKENPDTSIVLLDIMLPGIDGIEVGKIIRSKDEHVGIIMLTAKTMEEDKIQGLLSGADDYITKPFSPNELLARITSLLRRVSLNKTDLKTGLILNQQKRCLEKNGEIIELSPTEYEILSILQSEKGRAVSRNDILDEVWGLNFIGDPKIVDVNIRRIRQKVENDPSHPEYIQTVWGYGYKWVE